MRRAFTNRLRRLERRTRAIAREPDAEAMDAFIFLVQAMLLKFPPASPYPLGMSLRVYVAASANRWPEMRDLCALVEGGTDEAARYMERVRWSGDYRSQTPQRATQNQVERMPEPPVPGQWVRDGS